MLRCGKSVFVSVALVVAASLSSGTLYAGTIIKLSLGSDPSADIDFDGTTLNTVNASVPPTPGDQDTSIDYLDFLSGMTDVLPADASFTLSGLTAAPTASVFGGFLVIQDFTGGTFELYDTAPGYGLLLSGKLSNSTLTGPIGPPATGALFTSSFAEVTGGSLASLIKKDSLTLSMNLSDINGGAGFSVTPAGGPAPYTLNKFGADASLSIAAEAIPEPTSVMFAGLGALMVAVCAARRRN